MGKKSTKLQKSTVFTIKIYGEGLTEWYYFDKIRARERFVFSLEPGLPAKSRSSYKKRLQLINKELKRPPQERADLIILVTDLDNIVADPSEYREYLAAKHKYESLGVVFIESHPCIELWFLYHFKNRFTKSSYPSFDAIKNELSSFLPDYDKSGKYYSANTVFRDFIINSPAHRTSATGCAHASCQYSPVDGEICNYTNIHRVVLFLHMLQFYYILSDLLHSKVHRAFSLEIKVDGLNEISVTLKNIHLFSIKAERERIIWIYSGIRMEVPMNFTYSGCDDGNRKRIDEIANGIKDILDQN